jgi:hypothetical protein
MSRKSLPPQLSPDELAYADLLRRSAIESLEYAACYGQEGMRGKSAMKDRADAWRELQIESRRDLRDIERAFWIVLAKLRRYRLSPEQFATLAATLKEKGLMDVARAREQEP